MGEIHAGLGLFLPLFYLPYFVLFSFLRVQYLFLPVYDYYLLSAIDVSLFFFSLCFFPVPVARMYLQIETGLLCVFLKVFSFFFLFWFVLPRQVGGGEGDG